MGVYESAMIILPLAITVLIFLTSVISLAFYFAKEEEEKMELSQFIDQRSLNIKNRREKTNLMSINQYQRNARVKKIVDQQVSA